MIARAVALAVLLVAVEARAACTVGANCFADCVRNTDGGGNDVGDYANTDCQTKQIPKAGTGGLGTLVFAEDWEAPSLYGDASLNAGAPYYGPPYDPNDAPALPPTKYYYGNNSYMEQVYGGNGSNQLQDGQPASFRIGGTCDTNTGFPCFGVPFWVGEAQGDFLDGNGADAFGTNAYACLRAMRADDFDADSGPMPDLPNGSPGMYGNQVVANRWQDGTCGIQALLAPAFTGDQVCFAFIIAYSPSNMTAEADGVGFWDEAVKHPELGTCGSGFPMFGQQGICDADDHPFCDLIFPTGCGSPAALVAATTIHDGNGTKVQGGSAMIVRPANYEGLTDWADKATYAVVRAKMAGRNSTDQRNWTKVTIGSGSEVTLKDYTIAGHASVLDPMNSWNLDWYANVIGNHGPLDAPVYVYPDNIVVAQGAACEPYTATQLGFYSDGTTGGGAPDASGITRFRGGSLRGAAAR